MRLLVDVRHGLCRTLGLHQFQRRHQPGMQRGGRFPSVLQQLAQIEDLAFEQRAQLALVTGARA